MPISLNLPFAICYPMTLMARRFSSSKPGSDTQDQAAYFARQQRETIDRYRRHMDGLELHGKTVLDVGCGLGGRALGWLDLGASRVINVDINRQELEAGTEIIAKRFPEYASRVLFRHPDEMDPLDRGDVAILFDSFEHLTDPAAVLLQTFDQLVGGGKVWIGSIGWYNYMASHCSGHIPIPWSQVLFSERAIIETIKTIVHRPDYQPYIWEKLEGLDRWNSVTTLKDRPGEPLNMLSLRQVRQVLADSPFKLLNFKTFGFGGRGNRIARALSPLAKLPVLDEFFHSYYTAILEKPFPIPR